MAKCFIYKTIDQKQLEHLLHLEPLLQSQIGINTPITIRLMPNHFECLIHSIISQQLQSSTVNSIWNKLMFSFKKIRPKRLKDASVEQLTAMGLTNTKATLIIKIAKDVYYKRLNLKHLKHLSNDDIIQILNKYTGIGLWTIQMVLMFTYYRRDIIPFGDRGIQNGLKTLYEDNNLSKEDLEILHSNLGDYGTLFSICLWYINNNG